jgi:hypothetical protein
VLLLLLLLLLGFADALDVPLSCELLLFPAAVKLAASSAAATAGSL